MFASPQRAVSSRINLFTWVSQDGSTFQMGVDRVYCLRQRWVCSDRLGLSSVTCVLLCTCAEPGTTYLNSSGLALPSRGNADCLRVQHMAHFNLLFRDCGYTLHPQLTVSSSHLAIKTDPRLLHPHNFVNNNFRTHQYLYPLWMVRASSAICMLSSRIQKKVRTQSPVFMIPQPQDIGLPLSLNQQATLWDLFEKAYEVKTSTDSCIYITLATDN